MDWIELVLDLLDEFVLEGVVKAWRWVKNRAARRKSGPVSRGRAED